MADWIVVGEEVPDAESLHGVWSSGSISQAWEEMKKEYEPWEETKKRLDRKIMESFFIPGTVMATGSFKAVITDET